MSIESRARLLMDELRVSQKELEAKSGISQQVWSKAFNGRQRMNSTHIEFLCSEFKDYAVWLTTGSTDIGSTPDGAKALEYFSKVAEKYADIMAEYAYALEIKEYLSSEDPAMDDNGICIGSPMPSSRKINKQEYLDEIVTQEYKSVAKSLEKVEASEIKETIDHYFFSRSCSELVRLKEKYGASSRIYIMLNRLFGEILVPGSSSNVINPLRDQDPENGVDSAFFSGRF